MPEGHTVSFLTTHWTDVVQAARGQGAPARLALDSLCRTYWYPLYAYVRRRGFSPADAEDLTQGYFERLLRLGSLSSVGQARGRFRSFLLAGVNHYIADEPYVRPFRARAIRPDTRKWPSRCG